MKPNRLIRHWVHSHEEDSATEMVFRPATFKFPRSRGRTGFELHADGSLVDHGIGPADASAVTAGTWQEKGNGRIELYHARANKPARVLQMVRVDKDRLVVQRPTDA